MSGAPQSLGWESRTSSAEQLIPVDNAHIRYPSRSAHPGWAMAPLSSYDVDMVSVVVETHATSETNEKGIASGWRDPPLSDTGLEQAARLGSRRVNDGIAAVFCSDLQRVTQTAHIAFQNVDIPIYIDPRLRECNYGALSGMPANEVTGRRGQHIDIPHPKARA